MPPGAYLDPEIDDELSAFLKAQSRQVVHHSAPLCSLASRADNPFLYEVVPSLNIILRVMHERSRGEDSPFLAYINTMYEGMPDNPIFWSTEANKTKTVTKHIKQCFSRHDAPEEEP